MVSKHQVHFLTKPVKLLYAVAKVSVLLTLRPPFWPYKITWTFIFVSTCGNVLAQFSHKLSWPTVRYFHKVILFHLHAATSSSLCPLASSHLWGAPLPHPQIKALGAKLPQQGIAKELVLMRINIAKHSCSATPQTPLSQHLWTRLNMQSEKRVAQKPCHASEMLPKTACRQRPSAGYILQ